MYLLVEEALHIPDSRLVGILLLFGHYKVTRCGTL